MLRFILKLCCVALLLIDSVHAEETQGLNEKSVKLLNELKHTITQTISQVKQIEKSNGREIGDFETLLSNPNTKLSNLGLVLDIGTDADYFPILSVTPGSVAEKLGLRSGDNLYAIDGNAARLSNIDAVSAYLATLTDQQEITLDVQSNGKKQELVTTVSVTTIPGFTLDLINSDEQCGRIAMITKTTLDRAYFPLELRQINGRNFQYSGSVESGTSAAAYMAKFKRSIPIRLRVGSHNLKFKSELAAKHLKKRPYFKTLYEKKDVTLDIQPNVDYLLAAEIVDEEWQIKVIATKPYECELKWHD